MELELGPRGNWIVGGNAAGKTAALESIYCLSRGRSFRGRRFGSLVERGAASARVDGWLETEVGDARMRWTSARGEVTREPPQGAETKLPVRLICEWTHALVDGEPSLRRRFIDWNLMLWDRSAASSFACFRRVALQRNAWLRAGGNGRAVWDQPYAEALADVSRRRALFFDALARRFRQLSLQEGWFTEIDVRWDGVSSEIDGLVGKLREMRVADQARGFSYLGLARADFSLRSEGLRWVGSRGQAKVLGCMLQVAAERAVCAVSGSSALWLVDDLDAELAPEWTQRVVVLLRRNAQQVLYTALPGKCAVGGCPAGDDAVFHVEHGAVSRASG